MAVRVKICGVTSLEDARLAADLGAAAVGFNFYPRSPRYIAPQIARSIALRLPQEVCRVGVFVDEVRERVAAIADEVGLTALQFHGDESPRDCEGWEYKVIKAIRVRDRDTLSAIREYPVDLILADAYVEGTFGGSGKQIAIDLLEEIDPHSLIIAGGLTPENVAEVVQRIRPFGVDVASGVESAPGRKDPVLMRRFIDDANAA